MKSWTHPASSFTWVTPGTKIKQQAKSNEQRAKSNEQQAKCNEQEAKSNE